MERYTHFNAEFQRKARRDKKAFLSNQCKEIEESNRMGNVNISWFVLNLQYDKFTENFEAVFQPSKTKLYAA